MHPQHGTPATHHAVLKHEARCTRHRNTCCASHHQNTLHLALLRGAWVRAGQWFSSSLECRRQAVLLRQQQLAMCHQHRGRCPKSTGSRVPDRTSKRTIQSKDATRECGYKRGSFRTKSSASGAVPRRGFRCVFGDGLRLSALRRRVREPIKSARSVWPCKLPVEPPEPSQPGGTCKPGRNVQNVRGADAGGAATSATLPRSECACACGMRMRRAAPARGARAWRDRPASQSHPRGTCNVHFYKIMIQKTTTQHTVGFL